MVPTTHTIPWKRPREVALTRTHVAPRRGRSIARLVVPAVAALIALGFAPSVRAESRLPARIDDAIRKADLVFEGTVKSVEFRNARVPSGHAPVPHTFVTWQIHQIFKGRTPGAEITARFLGGMPDPDELLALSRSPRPDVGDRDVVFLARNGSSICPLVGCEDGLFRILDGAVYGERGQALAVRSDGTIHLGATRDDERVTRWDAVGIERVRGGSEVDGDVAVGAEPSDTAPGGPAMPADALRSLLAVRVAALYTPAQLARLRPVKSLDPDKRFSFRAPRAVPPPHADGEDAAAPPVEGRPDPAEAAAFAANGGNPVLPH